MAVIRSSLDRRSNINRRFLKLSVIRERRGKERRSIGERRYRWVRTSEWSSMDLSVRNQYYWAMIRQNHDY